MDQWIKAPESFKTTVEELRNNVNMVARRYALSSNFVANLRYLFMFNNDFSGIFPGSVVTSSTIETRNLGANKMQSLLPDVSAIEKLENLFVQQIGLKDPFTRVYRVQTLWISCMQLIMKIFGLPLVIISRTLVSSFFRNLFLIQTN